MLVDKKNFKSLVRSRYGRRKFTFQKTEYVSAYKDVIVTCQKHGDFSVAPFDLVRGSDCPGCQLERRRAALRRRFIARAKEVHSTRYSYSKAYRNAQTPITIRCKKHDLEFEMTPAEHLRGKRCPDCG